MAKKKASVFEATDDYGGQYRTKYGGIVTIAQGERTIDADVETMYVIQNGKKVLKFGWIEVFEGAPEPALSIQEREALELADAAAKNVKLKEKVDAADEEG